MDTLSVFLIAIGLFVLFVLFTAYFLKSYIVMNSADSEDREETSSEDVDPSEYSEMEEKK
ncbi:hypothetical protein [Methanolobus sp. WCC4]|uniref:hypothetical protein n=1 Tax=Methanolobus sp. WCC4 TaxID=3125784 RepID=UPI0030F5FA7A